MLDFCNNILKFVYALTIVLAFLGLALYQLDVIVITVR